MSFNRYSDNTLNKSNFIDDICYLPFCEIYKIWGT
jgi:hypothetical protein